MLQPPNPPVLGRRSDMDRRLDGRELKVLRGRAGVDAAVRTAKPVVKDARKGAPRGWCVVQGTASGAFD